MRTVRLYNSTQIMHTRTESDSEEGFLNVNLLQEGLGDSVEELNCSTPPEAHPHSRPRGGHLPDYGRGLPTHLEVTLEEEKTKRREALIRGVGCSFTAATQ